MQAPLPQLPRSCNSKGTNQTKQTSKAEVEQITPSQRLRYIVYCPNLLDNLKERTSSCLHSVHLDLQRHDHLIFAAHCLPELANSILPRIICIEEDVTTWVKHAILCPVVASLRAHHRKGAKLRRNPMIMSIKIGLPLNRIFSLTKK